MADNTSSTIPESHRPDPLLVSAPEARRLLGGISARKLAKMVAAGEVESVRIGTRRMFTLQGLQAFVAARTEGGS
ncbi:MAG: helix-turn-helix domain-containing protein [Planctomycetota bacterium]|nr:MAG: helix-turn-helix domain-containing protein [Planctomycetota bacterium]